LNSSVRLNCKYQTSGDNFDNKKRIIWEGRTITFEGIELLVSISRRRKCISYKSHREHLFTELCRPTCADWARKWSDGAEFPGTEWRRAVKRGASIHSAGFCIIMKVREKKGKKY